MGGSGLAAVALLALAYAAVSRRLSGSVITAAMVFVAGGMLVSEDALGWLDPTIESESVRVIAEVTLTLVLFSDASRLDLARLRREYVVPLRLLAIGLPLTIAAGALAGVAVLGGARAHRGRRARDRARPDRRRPRAGGRRRSPGPVTHPSGAERRERAQRWHLRAASPDRDRDRPGGGGRDRRRRGAAPRARGDRLRMPRRRDRGARSRRRGQARRPAPPGRFGLAPGRPGRRGRARLRACRVDGRQRVHRRLRRGCRLRRVASRGRRRGDALPRRGGRSVRCGHVHPLRRGHARARARRPLRGGHPVCAAQPDASCAWFPSPSR